MTRPTTNLTDLSRRAAAIERGIATYERAAEHYERLGPELERFVAEVLPERLAAAEAAVSSVLQEGDPHLSLGFDFGGLALRARPMFAEQKSVENAARAVRGALAQLRDAMRTLQGCASLAAGGAPPAAAAMRAGAAGARRQHAQVVAERKRVARLIAEEHAAIAEEREALAVARGEVDKAAE